MKQYFFCRNILVILTRCRTFLMGCLFVYKILEKNFGPKIKPWIKYWCCVEYILFKVNTLLFCIWSWYVIPAEINLIYLKVCSVKCFCKMKNLIILFYRGYYRGQSWRSGTKCDCKIDWLWVRSPLEEMKYLPKFIFPFLRSGIETKARRWVPPLNTQCLQNPAESGERSVITLCSLLSDLSVKTFRFPFVPPPRVWRSGDKILKRKTNNNKVYHRKYIVLLKVSQLFTCTTSDPVCNQQLLHL